MSKEHLEGTPLQNQRFRLRMDAFEERPQPSDFTPLHIFLHASTYRLHWDELTDEARQDWNAHAKRIEDSSPVNGRNLEIYTKLMPKKQFINIYNRLQECEEQQKRRAG